MKKTLLIVLSLLIGMVYINAQDFYFGPKTGLNFSYVNGISGTSKRVGAVVGVFAEKPINNWFSLQTELLYSTEGFKIRESSNTKKTYKMDYISVPVLAKIYMKGGFNIQFGAKFGVMVKSKYSSPQGLRYDPASYSKQRSGGIENKNKFSTSFVTGLGYDFNCGLLLECRYSLGINKLGSEEYWDGAARLGSLQLVTGWKF